MLRISLEQWRMFKAVVEYGGFNQASAAIYKSQSSIHKAVSKIEESLDIKLFKIEGRKTLLTDAGHLMLRRADYLLEEAQKLENIGHTLAQGVETHLKIAVDEVFPKQVLYRALDQVSEAFPHLRIELVESVLSGANQLLNDLEVDLAISAFPSQSGVNKELCTIEFIAVASPLHPLHESDVALSFEDLKHHRQIVVRDSNTQQKTDAGWLEAQQRWTVSHMNTSVDMICAAMGFAWLPKLSIQHHLDQGRLLPLKLKQGQTRHASLYLVFNDSDQLGPATQAFVDALESEVRC